MEANKVFGCDDLRKEILSYLPRRCLHCHKKMNNMYMNSYIYYWRDDLKKSEYLTACPIIKKGRTLKIEYSCGEILKNRSWKTNMNRVE